MSSGKAVLKQGWYLLKAKYREEIRAQDNLELMGFEAYCPMILSKSTRIPLFPSYLFIRLSEKDIPLYHKIRSTRGILQIVRFNKTNHKLYNEGRLPREEIASLLPCPMPNGDQIIDQIEAFIWRHDGCIPEAVSYT
nr:transcription termination/antitermination NusG family protein [Endozoicomonas sp.]